jgi:hypothetical protein
VGAAKAVRVLHVEGLERYARLSRMGALLVVCGAVAAAIGTWRGYAVAREALGPIVHDDGDPTRRAIDATRPPLARMRVREFARRTAVALGWLIVASYGLALLVEGLAVR